MLLTIIAIKLNYIGKILNKINTYKVKASQYNHITNDYNKKELKERWNKELNIQRNLYSAFLIMNVMYNLEEVDREQCDVNFDKFRENHNLEINRLRELRNTTKLVV